MASVSAPNGEAPRATNDATLLQLRYTELLEKRIAQLESIVETAAKLSPSDPPVNGVPPTIGTDTAPVSGDAEGDKEERKDLADKETPNGDKSKTQPKPRYRNVVRKFNKSTGAHEDHDVLESNQNKGEDGEVAFIFRKNVPLSDDVSTTETYSEIDVEAAGLRALLKECIGTDYPGQNVEGDTVNLVTPFAPLIHNWGQLEKATKPQETDDETNKQARKDLKKLMECVTTAPELEKYFKSRESNIRAEITTYESMWTLFAPKTKIVAKLFLDQVQILEVSRAPIPRSETLPRELRVLAWCWDWKGKEMVKVYYFLSIEQFWGTKDINLLPCYPLKYHEEARRDTLCKQIRERGEKYNKIVRSRPGATQMYIYEGGALSERRSVIKKPRETDNDGSMDDDEPNLTIQNRRKTVEIQGAYIVDPEAFLQFGGGTQVLGELEPVWVGELDSISTPALTPKQDTAEPTPDELLLFPPRFLGYSTKEKIWGQFAVDSTKDMPKKDISPFQEKLQLDKNYKDMIQALVEEHGDRVDIQGVDNSRVKVKDVVKDKGKGLVLLLHGPPGVGKTLTAETIAEATGKPLFVVSVAEIGLDASKAERNLEQMFYLAGKWEAVLLVDEADVFLEARTRDSDPNRNALVSVLLRVLEYYEGIMILTTNRITSLDIAVQSRIHLAIRYDDLTREQKINVFSMFLKQLRPDSINNYEDIMEYIDEYGSEYKLNGRQIRNVVSSALSLARSLAKENRGDGRMTVKHLKNVLMITKDFQEQLEAITMDQRLANEATRTRPRK